MVEHSDLSQRVTGSRAPERLAPLSKPPEDNARKRFELERERRRAEKERKEPTDPLDVQDRWDGGEPPDPQDGPTRESADEGTAVHEKPEQEGGLDVVA